MTLISSDEAKDFMKDQKTFDKNAGRELDWTDGKYTHISFLFSDQIITCG